MIISVLVLEHILLDVAHLQLLKFCTLQRLFLRKILLVTSRSLASYKSRLPSELSPLDASTHCANFSKAKFYTAFSSCKSKHLAASTSAVGS